MRRPVGLALLASLATIAAGEGLPVFQGHTFGPCQYQTVALVAEGAPDPTGNKAADWAKPDFVVFHGLTVAVRADRSMLFDTARLAFASWWDGGFLDVAKTHQFRSKGASAAKNGGKPLYRCLTGPAWLVGGAPADPAKLRYQGHYRHGTATVMHYAVDGRACWELPQAAGAGVRRVIAAARGATPMAVLVAAGSATTLAGDTGTAATADGDVAFAVAGAARLERDAEQRVWCHLPGGECRVVIGYGADDVAAKAAAAGASDDPRAMTSGGPSLWAQDVRSELTIGEPIPGFPYVLDTLSIPETPWGEQFRLGGIDCLSDGRLAVCTLRGDVWLVTLPEGSAGTLRWRRFATGGYEPLGLVVADDIVHVRCRDRILRLHDLDGDGEADRYETLFQEPEICANYHAFRLGLARDADGWLYSNHGDHRSTLTSGVFRVSADGSRHEQYAKGLRAPNGLAYGGPHGWLIVAETGHGAVMDSLAIVRAGASYRGNNGTQTEPALAVLPREIEASPGGGCWSDAKRWGPLGGTYLHTSYGSSRLSYVIVEDRQPHPNSFAVPMPLNPRSGTMRACVHPRDGQVYVAGQRGWDSNGATVACLHRIRHVANPASAPLLTGASTAGNNLRLVFSAPLEPASVTTGNVSAALMEFGGKRSTSASAPTITAATIDKGSIVTLTFADLPAGPALSLQQARVIKIIFRFRGAGGVAAEQTFYATLNGK